MFKVSATSVDASVQTFVKAGDRLREGVFLHTLPMKT